MIYCGNKELAMKKCADVGLKKDNPKITNLPQDFSNFVLDDE